jgi:hypothetical protein
LFRVLIILFILTFCQNAAPKKEPPKDWWDHFKENPYSIQEVEPGKVWQVAYTMENSFALE